MKTIVVDIPVRKKIIRKLQKEYWKTTENNIGKLLKYY